MAPGCNNIQQSAEVHESLVVAKYKASIIIGAMTSSDTIVQLSLSSDRTAPGTMLRSHAQLPFIRPCKSKHVLMPLIFSII